MLSLTTTEYLKEVCTRMYPKLGTVYCLIELVFCQKELPFCLDTTLAVMFFLLFVYIWIQGKYIDLIVLNGTLTGSIEQCITILSLQCGK